MPIERLDRALATRGLARSRTEAQALILAGQVRVDGRPAEKAGQKVTDGAALSVEGERLPYVSRGGLKLAAALDAFGVPVAGRMALDVGASTGGFTDCLLQGGAARVAALDAGHGQMAPEIAADSRVQSREGVNARSLSPADFDAPFDLVVADLSFISLTLVLPALAPLLRPDGDMILLVKPQFEVGQGGVGKGGVVRDPSLREGAVRRVSEAAATLGLATRGRISSPIKGGDGNEEYLLWLQSRPEGVIGDVAEAEAAQEPVDGEGEDHVVEGLAADLVEP
ncbi:MAG: TlyA family RNA methyltransferase [Armatimonadetes bacterium]|nr:TlyA family RNA methyltransferase [Armatimonadota bacterium]